MANLANKEPSSIWVGLLNGFPEGYLGAKHQKIKGGALTEKLIIHYGKRLSFNLLSLEPEIDGQFIDLDYCQLFYMYLSIMGW